MPVTVNFVFAPSPRDPTLVATTATWEADEPLARLEFRNRANSWGPDGFVHTLPTPCAPRSAGMVSLPDTAEPLLRPITWVASRVDCADPMRPGTELMPFDGGTSGSSTDPMRPGGIDCRLGTASSPLASEPSMACLNAQTELGRLRASFTAACTFRTDQENARDHYQSLFDAALAAFFTVVAAAPGAGPFWWVVALLAVVVLIIVLIFLGLLQTAMRDLRRAIGAVEAALNNWRDGLRAVGELCCMFHIRPGTILEEPSC